MSIFTGVANLNWNYQTIAATSAITAYLIIILLVAVKARRHRATRVFILANCAVIGWITSFDIVSMVKDKNTALFFVRIFEIGAIFPGPLYYHVALKVFNLKVPRRYYIAYLLAAIFVVFDLFTPYFIKGVVHRYWYSYWYVEPGPLYYILPFFFSYFVFNCCYKPYLYSKEYPSQRNQAIYFIIGILAASTGGLCYFLSVFGLLIPFAHDYLTILLPIATTYDIIRHRLMEIDTVIHRTLLWMLTSTLIFIPISTLLYFTRPWLAHLKWIQLAFTTTVLFYLYLYYYHKMQPKIDHLFRRRKYDYYQTLSEIGEKIGSELDINDVIVRLFKELKEILYIRNGHVLVQQLGQQDYTEAGSLGYENLPDASKSRQGKVLYTSSLSQWLNMHKKALEREQVEIDPRYQSIKEEALSWLSQNMIEVLIPVVMEDKLNGLVGIGKKENLQAYTSKDVELLEKMGRQLGVIIDNALHHEDIVEKGRLDEELKLGREIQRNLLPKQIPQVPCLSLQGMMTPAKEIGGDYYDFITLPNKEELAIVIGDVSGKGVAAGLLMSMVKASIYAFSQEGASPKQILLRTNAFLHQNVGGQKFMTLLYFKWRSQSRTLTYSSAGHEHILIFRCQSQQVEAVQSGGFMLGMMPDIDKFLEEKEIELNPRDKILLYTDGVTEAENQKGDRFGLDSLKESFQRHSQKPAQELMQAVKDEVYAFIGSYPQYDDITLVVMEAQ